MSDKCQPKRRMKKKSDLGCRSAAAKRSRLRLQNETPEERLKRLVRTRESQRRRFENETLLEKEERLAKARWLRAKQKQAESYKASRRRLEEKRIQLAIKKSKMEEELQRTQHLMETEDTFETIFARQIRDQLFKTQPKVLRLSATNVKHVQIFPDIFVKNSNPEALHESSLRNYSSPMEDGFNSDDECLFEPKVVVNELDDPPNNEPMIRIKTIPMASEFDDPQIIIGIPDISSNPEPMNSEPDVKCQAMASEPECELITGDIGPNLEPMVSETDISGRSQRMDSDSASREIKCEINIKSEVYTEEL